MAFKETPETDKSQQLSSYDVFISYSRRDKLFARKLCEALVTNGLRVWVDWENIPATSEWRSEILSGIEKANNFLFIISNTSIKSEVCNEEIAHAIRCNKRLMPITCEKVNAKLVHPELAKIHWINFETGFCEALQNLISSLNTNLDYVRTHTRLIVRAQEWESRSRDSSFLLRGNDLLEAEKWLQSPTNQDDPKPTDLHQIYIATSRHEENRRLRSELALSQITPQQYRNRQALLFKVRNFWIKNVLETSLHEKAILDLDLLDRKDMISHPWEIILEATNDSYLNLSERARLIDFFDYLGPGRTLLILGDPGAGKTTTLLELARDLISRAEYDFNQLIPVVFNLSSWQGGKQKIFNWIIEELNSKYQIPKKISELWIQEQKLLLLLDGLDEVQSYHRESCVESLNEFIQECGAEVVVCSRTEDYKKLSQRLQFQGAIEICPLDPLQVEDFLNQGGDKLEVVRKILQEDKTLQKMVCSPLILNILMLAYQDIDPEELPKNDLDTRRRHLLDTYIKRMIQKKGASDSAYYTSERIINWLRRLAKQILDDGQTVFLIEKMQPTWLKSQLQRWLYSLTLGILISTGLTILLQPIMDFFSRLIGLRAPWSFLLPLGVILGALWGIVALQIQDNVLTLKSRTILGFASSFVVVLYASIYGVTLSIGLLSGLVYGLLVAIFTAFLPYNIYPLENFNWSWDEAKIGAFSGMKWGIWIGLLFGVLMGFLDAISINQALSFNPVLDSPPLEVINILISGWFFMLINGLIFALIFEFVSGIIGGVINGLSQKYVQRHTSTNYGILQSAKSTVVFSGLGAICTGTVFGLLGAPILPSILLGLVFGLLTGGVTCLQHLLLRTILFLWGEIPWNYKKFLDFSTRHIFLQKVGGGYIFVHRLLLEHFANKSVNL